MVKITNFGSICSGIETASFVLKPLGIQPVWLSEIADFQNRFLASKYPDIPNLGDMNNIPKMIEEDKVIAPDMICGGTPCQAFSLAGWRNGINDDRGQLTLKYIDIVNAIDKKRRANGKNKVVFFWENVDGALSDKTNAFGCLLSGLLGLNEPINVKKWTQAGFISGKERNIAWRVLDAKYFGVPQQRKRIYVLGGGKDFHPEQILFEKGHLLSDPLKQQSLSAMRTLFPEYNQKKNNSNEPVLLKEIDGHSIEAFRSYSDCLYAAYGTKWNGNAAAFNGSLFFSQNGRLRRLSPLECERLMGFPDNYTLLNKCKDTQRYQAVGNSWVVPVIEWIAKRLINDKSERIHFNTPTINIDDTQIYLLSDFTKTKDSDYINSSKIPYKYKLTNMVDLADINTPEKFYITAKGCGGILRRRNEHRAGMNERLEIILKNCSTPEKAY